MYSTSEDRNLIENDICRDSNAVYYSLNLPLPLRLREFTHPCWKMGLMTVHTQDRQPVMSTSSFDLEIYPKLHVPLQTPAVTR